MNPSVFTMPVVLRSSEDLKTTNDGDTEAQQTGSFLRVNQVEFIFTHGVWHVLTISALEES